MNEENNPPKENPTNPNKWKFGIFYCNKDDKRIFAPKHVKQLGWTINFAHWQSWLILLIVILIPICLKLF
jgi:uncharacterized membrane protein